MLGTVRFGTNMRNAMNKIVLAAIVIAIFSIRLFGENYMMRFSDMEESLAGKKVANWSFDKFGGKDCVLCSSESTLPFSAQASLPKGDYYVWVDCFDMPKLKVGHRSFDVSINSGDPIGSAGDHGSRKNGWLWTKTGKFQWKGGNISASILPRRAGPVRVHALLFTEDESFNPNAISPEGGQLWKSAKPLKVGFEANGNRSAEMSRIAVDADAFLSADAAHFEISNPSVKVIYTKYRDSEGRAVYGRSVEAFKDGKKVLSKNFPEEAFFVGYCKETYMFDRYFASWAYPIALDGGGRLYELRSDPYAFEKLYRLPVRSVEKVSGRVLKLGFDFGAFALCSLDENSPAVRFDFEFPAAEDGFFTAVFMGFGPAAKENVKAVSLPPIYHRRTFMRNPSLVCDRVVSQPYAAVQLGGDSGDYTCALIASPEIFDPFSWPTRGTSRCGFSICSSDGSKVGASYFQPVLGGKGSYKKAGEKVRAEFYAAVLPGDWSNVARLVNTRIYSAGKTVRQPEEASLSAALSNIIGCMSDDEAGGWSSKLKARWNIEGLNLVTVASPLTEVSVSVLTRDEDYYWRRSLPTIEYLLSRNAFHFTPETKNVRYYAKGQEDLHFPCESFGEDLYLSMNALTGGLNPVFVQAANIAAEHSEDARANKVDWSTQLGAYLATSDEKYLIRARSLCDAWLHKAFWETSAPETSSYLGFVNFNNYPQWWYLPDMYEITKEKKYLDYAVLGAYHSAVSAWNFPNPAPGASLKINEGGLGVGLFPKWYKGDKRFRLGSETRDKMLSEGVKFEEGDWVGQWPLPERIVSGSRASRLGFGVEGVSSLTCTLYGDMNILIPSWAAEILITGHYAGDECLVNLSRHGIIGRFANYPGYYITSFDDSYARADYPYKGPDITSIYYHHMPCFFAQAMDYLMTQYFVSSRGRVKFGYLRQKGYVWFVDRIYGPGGMVYGESARPMLSGDALRMESPNLNVIYARAENSIWALLLNDSLSDEELCPDFNFSSKVFDGLKRGEKCRLYTDGKASGEYDSAAKGGITVPSGKIVAIRFPADEDSFMKGVRPISSVAHKTFKCEGKDLTDVHIFRIRSPFGKDSVFAVAFGPRDFEGTFLMQVHCGGEEYKSAADSYPFEASVIKLPMDKTASVKIYSAGSDGEKTLLAECEI